MERINFEIITHPFEAAVAMTFLHQLHKITADPRVKKNHKFYFESNDDLLLLRRKFVEDKLVVNPIALLSHFTLLRKWMRLSDRVLELETIRFKQTSNLTQETIKKRAFEFNLI